MNSLPLDQFIKKYQTAKNYNSKELRITLQEAEELSSAIASLLSNVVILQEKIIDLQDKLLNINVEGESTSNFGNF